MARPSKVDEVWACLARVMDPELDEPITEVGFVERVAVSDRGEVEFRLPTYRQAAGSRPSSIFVPSRPAAAGHR